MKILANYDIYVLTYKELNLSRYRQIAESLGKPFLTIFYDSSYFVSVQAYNRLLFEKSFYKSFLQFKFILIYQLDAWVFRDELSMWCDKGYDYIGAPLFDVAGHDSKGNPFYTNEMAGVGNGGFSLRRTVFCYKMLDRFRFLPLIKPVPLWKTAVWKYRKSKKRYVKAVCETLLKSFGYRNTINYYAKNFKLNEDMFFSLYVGQIWFHPKVNLPSTDEAMRFSFEVNPSLLYARTLRLPFGCHAFEKFEYNSFWREYIKFEK